MERHHALGTDATYLREHQYKDPSNLTARIALHQKYGRADEPWYPWLIGNVPLASGTRVLDVGCGPGLVWVHVAELLPPIRLTLTDLSPGMVDAARAAVEPLPNVTLADARSCDAQDLPFDTGAFDVVVANHMLYHVPEPTRAAAEFARVLTPGGVLMAATNGPGHLDAIRALTREVFGWSSLDGAVSRFAPENGGEMLRTAFADVAWHPHPSTMVCTDPEDVYAFIASSPPGQEATAAQLDRLHDAIETRFAAEGGSLTVTSESGCLVARDPLERPR